MKTLAVIILLLISAEVHAQQFVAGQSIKLNKSITNSILESADFNNDGLLDVVMFTTHQDGTRYLQFIKNDSTDGFVLLPISTNVLIDSFSGYSILDYDGDNDIDIMVYGNTSFVYMNKGNFTFLKKSVNLPPFTITRWADLDNNGSREIIGSDESITRIYQQQPDSSWQQQGETMQLTLSALEVLDANADGYKDLFVSGNGNADSLFTGFLINGPEFQFKPMLSRSLSGHAAIGDLNSDGLFDVAFVGLDSTGGIARKVILSKNEKFVMRDTTFAITSGSVFISDFNADGLADISTVGKSVSTDTVHSVLFADGNSETVKIQKLISQQFLDFNRDGNLDMARATRPDSIHITFYTNQAVENEGPGAPQFALSNKIFDRYFFYWSPSVDDHTASKSLTYDFLLQGDKTFQAAEFDFSNERRLLTSHGNMLTQNFKLFNALPSIPSGFGIQAVDNSFHALFVPGNTEICVGTVSETCPLLESQAELIRICPSEVVTLEASNESHWFSFTRGYLGAYEELVYTPTTTDTLFYYDPAVFDCTALKAFIIEIRNVSTIEYESRYACENQTIKLEAEESWQSVHWTSQVKGDLGLSTTIQYKVVENDSIFALLTGNGCSVLRKTAVIISKPEITVEHDQLAILKGNSVQLQAVGGKRYEWSPAATLSDAAVSNPVASPVSTTTYFVTGYDSINCSSEASVRVTVESTGFVPTLFTPNDDGSNDALRVYGLREARAFSFTIYNREGKIVYETQYPSEVTSSGWDGRRNGLRQPAGVYFWKVKGWHPSGEAVKLNGKSEGSIILVR